MKQTPKSCGCFSCKRGKSSKAGNASMKATERSYRHKAKIAIKQGKEDITIAPHGDYTD